MSEPPTIKPAPAASPSRAARAIPAISYAVVTAVFWGRFVLERGLHAETVWIELSQQRPGLEGFLYPYDASRRFMSVPFHAAYLLSNGSYLPLHLIFGLFVFLTGWLTWLLVRRLLPGAPLVAFIAGALAIAHGADLSTNTTPMIVVRQAVVCVLGALLLLRVGWERDRPWLLAPAAILQGVSLWTYEPGLLMLVFGPIVIWSGWSRVRRWLAWTAAWVAVPALLVFTIVERYVIQGQTSYQSAQMRAKFDAAKAAASFPRLLYDGVAFWEWPLPWYRTQMNGCVDEVVGRVSPALIGGALLFLALALAWRRLSPHGGDRLPWRHAALAGAGFLVTSYLPFLALGEVGAWRTQFYAAPAAAVLLAIAFVGVDRLVRARGVVAVLLATAAVGSGMFVGLVSQLEMSYRWRLHRDLVTGIVEAAPRIADGTLVALTGVPTGFPYPVCSTAPPVDPFLDTFWFNSALRVLYPGTDVTATYWRVDGTSPGAIQVTFDREGASIRDGGTDRGRISYSQIVAFQYDPRTGSHLLESFPAASIPGSTASATYAPRARILPGPPAAETIHRLAR